MEAEEMIPVMFPVLLIAIGIAVLLFGKRLAVLGAAVGALVGVGLLYLFPSQVGTWLQLAVPLVLAVLGFFFAGFAKGIVNIVVLVIGALAGAAIMQGFLDFFAVGSVMLDLLLVVLGGVIGWVVVGRFKDAALVILAGLVGGLLVTRGLASWLPFLNGTIGSLLTLALMVVGIVFQGGFSGGRKSKG
jgi:hypothetical protein